MNGSEFGIGIAQALELIQVIYITVPPAVAPRMIDVEFARYRHPAGPESVEHH